MDDLILVGSALHGALAAGTIDWYRNVAPGTAVPPYGVWSLQSGSDAYDFGGKFATFDYNVRVITDDDWPTRGEGLAQAAMALIDNVALTIPGYDHLECRRSAPVHFRDPDGFWNIGGIFRVWVHD